MAALATAQRMTEAEFLAFERDSDVKHQFFEGEVFAQVEFTPSPEPHSQP